MTPFLLPTDQPDVFELHVDNSAKELFETCSRASEYYTTQRRQLAGERAALFFGGVIHKALVPRKLQLPEWQKEQERIIIEEFTAHPPGPDEWRTVDRAIDVIHQYNKAYPLDAEPFKLLPGCCEMPFKLLLGEAELDSMITDHRGTYYVKKVIIYWTGRIDAIIDYGSILIQDHKTTSILGPTFYDDFQLASQMIGYTWAGRKLGHSIQGLLLDVFALRKPTRTGKSTEFQRQRYFYSDEHIDEWEKDTFTIITDFLEHLCRGYFPKMTKWCHGKYGTCQYWSVCTSLPSQRADVLASPQYTDVEWSPLL